MNFKPSLDRVLVKKEKAGETTSASGLITILSPPENEATVVAVGPGARYWDSKENTLVTIPVGYEVGQRVMVPQHGLTPLTIEGTEYFLLKESEILGSL